MANMSYCQFENTASAMKQCFETLQEAVDNGLSFAQFMKQLGTDYERQGARRIDDLMLDMANAFEQLRDNEGLCDEELEELEN